jgi:hypothetical protein
MNSNSYVQYSDNTYHIRCGAANDENTTPNPTFNSMWWTSQQQQQDGWCYMNDNEFPENHLSVPDFGTQFNQFFPKDPTPQQLYQPQHSPVSPAINSPPEEEEEYQQPYYHPILPGIEHQEVSVVHYYRS